MVGIIFIFSLIVLFGSSIPEDECLEIKKLIKNIEKHELG